MNQVAISAFQPVKNCSNSFTNSKKQELSIQFIQSYIYRNQPVILNSVIEDWNKNA